MNEEPLSITTRPLKTRFSAEELFATTFPEPRFAVPGMVAEGLNLLAGAPKLGKSWLALNLSVAVASGGYALGSVKVEQGETLYLALEDSPRRIQQRLKAVLQGSQVPKGFTVDTAWPALKEGCEEELDIWLTAHPDTRLVVIDVLAGIRASTPDKADRYQGEYLTMESLKKVADRHSTALLCVHHTRKAVADDFLDTVSGTHGIAGACDTILVLKRSRTEADAELSVTGRDIEEQRLALSFSPQIGTWVIQGDVARFALAPESRAIVDLLADVGTPLTPKEISAQVTSTHDSVKHLVIKLAEQGHIDATGRGTYVTHSLHSPRSPNLSLIPKESERSEQGE